jgi:hypothetical protein
MNKSISTHFQAVMLCLEKPSNVVFQGNKNIDTSKVGKLLRMSKEPYSFDMDDESIHLPNGSKIEFLATDFDKEKLFGKEYNVVVITDNEKL